MRKFLILIFTFLYFILNAQIKNGIVEYSVVPIENGSGLDKLYEGFGVNFVERAKKMNFKLIFNQQKGFFDISKDYKNDSSQETMLAKIKIGYQGEIFQEKDSVFTDISSDNFLGEKLIIRKPIENKWELSNETKMIDDLLCYKATTEIVLMTPNKTFHHPITAWYCPKIPVPFGPFGFGNLPGLILELQTKDGVFGAKSIKLNEIKEGEIPEINKKVKVISEKDLNGMIEKYNDAKKE